MLRLRRAGLLAGAGLLVWAAAAGAKVSTSNITSPANGAYYEEIESASSPSTTIAVNGTTDGNPPDTVTIRCFWGVGTHSTLASGVAVQADHTFSTTTASLAGSEGHACRLRADPGSPVSIDSAVFAGPHIAVSGYLTDGNPPNVIPDGPNIGALVDFQGLGTTFTGMAKWSSAGDCGPSMATFDPSFALPAQALFCVGSLRGNDGISRSEIQVDGKNAYDVNSAFGLFGRSGSCPPTCDGSEDNANFPALTTSQSWNPATGLQSTQENEGIVACSGADAYAPPDQAACPSFQSTGVQLHRTVSMLSSDQAIMTDTWSSIDGHGHVVDALYDDDAGSGAGGPAFAFPGELGFARHPTGDVLGGPASAPGSILVHSGADSIDGDPTEQYGAITFASAPSEYVFSANNEFNEHQTVGVPAGGSATLTYIYSTGTTLEGVQALALAAQDELRSPAVSISSPANGLRVKSKTVNILGTASAGSGIRSVTVNGDVARIGANGMWSVRVTLSRGANTITATATSNAGQTASAHITLIYSKRCVVPDLAGLKLSRAERALRAAGCLVGKLKREHSGVGKGHVIATRPRAGATRKPGAKVKLIVSEG